MVEGSRVEVAGAPVSVSVEVRTEVPASPDRPSTVPLPRTGWDAGGLAAVGLALILLGSIVVLLVRTQVERTTHA